VQQESHAPELRQFINSPHRSRGRSADDPECLAVGLEGMALLTELVPFLDLKLDRQAAIPS
jgi:hypothetical protein